MTDMERFIDVAVEQFARNHTEPETDLYVRLREETYRVMKWPEMQVDAIEGRFLKMLVRLTRARTVLELGMFTVIVVTDWLLRREESLHRFRGSPLISHPVPEFVEFL